jgi:molecular chaperone GrpE
MTEGAENDTDERLLTQFREWLQEARREAGDAHPEPAPGAEGAGALPGFSFEHLVGEFTALRHEVKLQTRSSRALEELVGPALTALTEAAATFRSAAAQLAPSRAEPADKQFAVTLAELDEALERGREQWKKNSARLIGPGSSPLLAQIREHHAGQSWWQRRLTAASYRRLCEAIERAEEQALRDRRTILDALLSGAELIQQRLARAMAGAGVARIPTLGRPVDPELMVVVDVVEAEGPAGQVVEETRPGYTWKGALLRPAEVRAIRPRFGH